MMSPFDFRDLMKAHFQYNETRSVDDVLAEQKARDASEERGVSKEPPAPGRSATRGELDVLRAMMQGSTSDAPQTS